MICLLFMGALEFVWFDCGFCLQLVVYLVAVGYFAVGVTDRFGLLLFIALIVVALSLVLMELVVCFDCLLSFVDGCCWFALIVVCGCSGVDVGDFGFYWRFSLLYRCVLVLYWFRFGCFAFFQWGMVYWIWFVLIWT